MNCIITDIHQNCVHDVLFEEVVEDNVQSEKEDFMEGRLLSLIQTFRMMSVTLQWKHISVRPSLENRADNKERARCTCMLNVVGKTLARTCFSVHECQLF